MHRTTLSALCVSITPSIFQLPGSVLLPSGISGINQQGLLLPAKTVKPPARPKFTRIRRKKRTVSILFFPTIMTRRPVIMESGPSSVSMLLLYRSRKMRFGRLARLVTLLMRLFW